MVADQQLCATRLAAHTWMRIRNFWAGLDANAARGLPGAEYKCHCRRQASPPPTAPVHWHRLSTCLFAVFLPSPSFFLHLKLREEKRRAYSPPRGGETPWRSPLRPCLRAGGQAGRMVERDPLKPNAGMKTEYQLQALLDKVLPATCNRQRKASTATCNASNPSTPETLFVPCMCARTRGSPLHAGCLMPAGRRNGRTA